MVKNGQINIKNVKMYEKDVEIVHFAVDIIVMCCYNLVCNKFVIIFMNLLQTIFVT